MLEAESERRSPATLATGELKDVQSRSVQAMGGNPNCLGVNLSSIGAVMLGLSVDDDVTLRIYEDGIWVSRSE